MPPLLTAGVKGRGTAAKGEKHVCASYVGAVEGLPISTIVRNKEYLNWKTHLTFVL